MSRGELYFLVLVLAAFTAFGVTLAVESWLEARHNRHE
jgi:hypothetical protein